LNASLPQPSFLQSILHYLSHHLIRVHACDDSVLQAHVQRCLSALLQERAPGTQRTGLHSRLAVVVGERVSLHGLTRLPLTEVPFREEDFRARHTRRHHRFLVIALLANNSSCPSIRTTVVSPLDLSTTTPSRAWSPYTFTVTFSPLLNLSPLAIRTAPSLGKRPCPGPPTTARAAAQRSLRTTGGQAPRP